jgi:hypothetical protein
MSRVNARPGRYPYPARVPNMRGRHPTVASVVACAVLAVLLGACATSPVPTVSPGLTGGSPAPTGGSGTTATPASPPADPGDATASPGGIPTDASPDASLADSGTVSGVVVDIRQSNPVTVTRFTIRTIDDRELTFAVGELDLSDGAFPASHLREHQATTQPVLVDYRREGEDLVAIRLEDDPR